MSTQHLESEIERLKREKIGKFIRNTSVFGHNQVVWKLIAFSFLPLI